MTGKRMPGLEPASIAESKVRGYLLSAEHPSGRAKAAFFLAFGFDGSRWPELREALLAHGRDNLVVRILPAAEGMRYIVEGPLSTPAGRAPRVRTVWTIHTGETLARFITAYPCKEEGSENERA